jgi:hypothetical protein
VDLSHVAAGNPGGLGQKAAQFRSRHEMAVQQHQLCDRRRNRRQDSRAKTRTVSLNIYVMPDGKYEQFLVIE